LQPLDNRDAFRYLDEHVLPPGGETHMIPASAPKQCTS
jgi:hypothetical protein